MKGVLRYLFGVFQRQPGEIGGLNGIRSIAYFMLIYAHLFRAYRYFGIDGDNEWVNNFLNNGSLCMDAFFSLSGFLIFVQLFRELKNRQTISLRKFFTKRILRILPPYYIFITWQYFMLGSIQNDALPEIAEGMRAVRSRVIYDYLYLSDYIPGSMTHGWSLSIEEKFYLLLPLALLLLNRVKHRVGRLLLLSPFLLVPLLFRAYYYAYLTSQGTEIDTGIYLLDFYYPFHARMDSLFVGVIFSAVYTYFPDSVISYLKRPISRYAAAIGFLGLMAIMLFTTEGYPDHPLNPQPAFFVAVLRTLVGSLCWLSIMVLALNSESLLGKTLSLRIFVPVAKLSYCGYIIHLVLMGALSQMLIGYRPITYLEIFVWTFLLGTIILGFAYLYYLVAERPFLLLKEKLTGRRPAVDALGEKPVSGAAA